MSSHQRKTVTRTQRLSAALHTLRAFPVIAGVLVVVFPSAAIGRTPTEYSVKPSSCTGWQNSDRATSVDLPPSSDWQSFGRENSALYRFTPAQTGAFGEAAPNGDLRCSGFALHNIDANASVTGAVLQLSLAALAPLASEDVLVPSFSFDDGGSWMTAPTLVVRGIISNARNDGYGRIALPDGTTRNDLDHFQFRLHYASADQFTPTTLYIDGAQLRVTVAQPQKKRQGIVQWFFSPDEEPTILVDQKSLDAIEVLDAEGHLVNAPFATAVTDDGTTITVKKGRTFRPGTYILRTKSHVLFWSKTEERSFTYGQINFNTPKAVYEPGDIAAFALGVVDHTGRTVCDAALTLSIRKPNGARIILSTADHSIAGSKTCGAESLTSIPDYSASIVADQIGAYDVTLTAQTDKGPVLVHQKFTVTNEQHDSIERLAPTRINPRAPYVVKLRFIPADSYQGIVEDVLPVGFTVTNSSPHADVQEREDGIHVLWKVDWLRGLPADLSYTFDAPDISPALFLLGPATFGNTQEQRQWTISADEVVRKEKGDVQYDLLPITERDWIPERSTLVQPDHPVIDGKDEAHILVYKKGYRLRSNAVPAKLKGATAITVSNVDIIGPGGSKIGTLHVSEEFRKGDQYIEMLHLVPGRGFHPGVYTIVATLTDGKRSTTEFTTFAWGVVAVNMNKSVYQPGETAQVYVGAVDAIGRTVCDADVSIVITVPGGSVTTLTTKDGTVVRSPECGPITVTNTPDYSGLLSVPAVGEYQVVVQATISAQTYTVSDVIRVQEDVPFRIERNAPTRVFPPADYDISFSVTPQADYRGQFEESVPKAHEIISVGQNGSVDQIDDQTQRIRWTVDWKAGEEYTLSYRLNPQDIAPALFQFGPASVGEFSELRQWQMAADALVTISGTIYDNEGSTVHDCETTPLSVAVKVNGGGTASTVCDQANGTYSVTDVSVSAGGDVLTVYGYGTSFKSADVTRAADATSNVTDLNLYKSWTIVRHEDGGPITNTNLDQWDSGNNANVPFTVTGGALSLTSGRSLLVWTGKTFTPGGTVTTSLGGSLHIDSSATFSPEANAVTINGSWDNDGTFTAGTSTVTFNATSSGKTLSGRLNNSVTSSAFNKVAFTGTGGIWTIADPMLVSAANATDTFVQSAGTVILGDGNGDNLEVDGKWAIATTANQSATFQTAALAEGSSLTIDLNANSSTPSCANCIIALGASSGSGLGTFTLQKNSILRLNPRNTATVSDTGVSVASTGFFQAIGSQDVTGTLSAATEAALTDSSKSWTTNQHLNKIVRITNTSSLAFGKTYSISSNTGTALVIADASSADTTVQSFTTTGPTTKICTAVNSLITANNEGIGRYVHDATGTTGYLKIVDSTNNDATCTGSTDSLKVIAEPGAFAILANSDTIDISDGIQTNDTYEILDYASVTAENGTACNAAVNGSGEGYIYSASGGQVTIQYAEVCNLGRNATNLRGIEVAVNGANSGEGIVLDKSSLHNNYEIVMASAINNSAANSKGITNNLIYSNGRYGIQLTGGGTSCVNYIGYNRIYSNTSTGIYNNTSCGTNAITGNYIYSNTTYGIEVYSYSDTFTSNKVWSNTTSGGYINYPLQTFTSNDFFGHTSDGFYNAYGTSNAYISNNVYANDRYGMRFTTSGGSVVRSNNVYANPGSYGLYIDQTSTGMVVESNTFQYNAYAGIYLLASNSAFYNNTIHHDSNSGPGLDIDGNTAQTVLSVGNTIYSETGNGIILNGTNAHTLYSIGDTLGVGGSNASDIRHASTGVHKSFLFGTTLGSTNEATAVTTANSSIISRKHDGTNGAVRVWNDYAIPTDNAETPQDEDTEQYNYANNLWGDSTTPHLYTVGQGAGTEDTDIDPAISGTFGGDANAYVYRIYCNTSNCVTSGSSWDVYRNGTLLTAKASTGSTYTDTQVDGSTAPNVQFLIQDAGTDYTRGATYVFAAYKAGGGTNTQKTITMMQDADTFTVGSGTKLELKGQSAGTNVTQVTRGASGGYQFSVAGTIDFNAYSFNYLGGAAQASGLDLNTGATITSLDNGSFDNYGTNVGAADSFVDIDSSLIGAETPTSIYDAVSFTNTGGNANCNVNATGADAAGYAQFTGSTGAFGVEASDCNDGAADADPGQVKWGGIKISGTVYSDEGSTAYNCSSDNLTIDVSVNGGANSSTTCTVAAGTFTIAAATPSVADPINVFIDSAETPKATTATLASSTTAAISGLNLYQNRLIVSHENAGPITNAKLATGDNADAGIRYGVASSNLTVDSGIELHVWTGKTFTPGGTVTTQAADVHIPSTSTFSAGGNAVTVGGAWTNAGTYTPGANTTTFNAISGTNTINSTGASSAAFNNLTFDDGGNSGTFQLSSALDADGTLTITGGTLNANSQTINVGGNWLNGDLFTHGSGTVTFDATASGKTINPGSSSFFNLTFNGSGGAWSPLTNTVTVTNDLTMTAGTFDTSNGTASITVNGNVTCGVTCGTINMTSTNTFTQSVATSKSFGPNVGTTAWTFYNLTHTSSSGTPTITFASTGTGATTVSNNYATSNSGTSFIVDNDANDRILDVNGNVTIGAGTTLTASSSAAFTVAGTWTNGGTFTASGGTVTFDATATGKTINPGSSSFYNLTFNGSGGEWSPLTNTVTVTGDLTMTAGTFDTSNGTASVTVNGNVTCGVTCGTIDMSTAGTNLFTQSVATNKTFGTTTGSGDWTFYNLTMTSASGTPTITFNGTGNGLVVANNNFSMTNGGTSLTVDDNTNNRDVFIGGDMNIGSGTTLSAPSTGSIQVGGSWTNSGTFTHNSGTVMFIGSSPGKTINPGASPFHNVTFNGIGGVWSPLTNTVTIANDLRMAAGTFDTSSGTANVTVNGSVLCSGTCGTIAMVGTNTFTQSVTASETFGPSAGTTAWSFYNLTFTSTANSPTVTFNGTGTGAINVLNNLVTSTSGTALTVDNETNDRTLNVDNDLTMGANTTLQASSTATFTVGGSWTNSGTFTPGTGTVVLDSIGGSETINNGSSSFHSLALDSGLVGYYKLDEGAGTAATADASRYGNTGTLTNVDEADWVASTNTSYYGSDPGALNLDSSGTEFVDLGNPDQLNTSFTNQITIAAWIKPASGTGQVIVGKSNAATHANPWYKWILYKSSLNRLHLRIDSTSVDSADNLVTNGEWQHVAGVYDGSLGSDNLKLYKNGSEDANHANKIANIQSSSQNVRIGARHTPTTGDAEYYNGAIDDVRIYKRALSDTEITNLASGTQPSVATFTLASALDVNGDLTVSTGSLDVSASGCSGVSCAVTIAGSYKNVANLEPRTGTMTFDGTASGKTIQSDPAFYNLLFTGSGGVWTLNQQRLNVNNDLTITNGTLDVSASSCNGGTSCSVSVGGNWDNDATFTPRTGTVTLDAASETKTIDALGSGTPDFYNVTLNDGGGGAIFQLTTTADINGAFTNTSGTFQTSGNAMTVASNWTNNGTFTHGSGTVTLDGSNQQTASGTLTGSSAFNNLTMTNASGSDPDTSPSVIFGAAATVAGTFTATTANTKIRFNAGSTYTLPTLTLNGQATGTRVYLRSSSSGTAWNLTSNGTPNITYTDVKDSDASASSAMIDARSCTNNDSGNNTNWNIGKALTFSLDTNTAALGTLASSTINKAGIQSTVTTCAPNGFTSYANYDHALQIDGSHALPDESGGGTIIAGTPEFGASTSEASAVDIAPWSPAACTTSTSISNATALSTSVKSYAIAIGAVTNDQTTLCFMATINALSAAGTYGSAVTLTTTAKF